MGGLFIAEGKDRTRYKIPIPWRQQPADTFLHRYGISLEFSSSFFPSFSASSNVQVQGKPMKILNARGLSHHSLDLIICRLN